MKRTLLGAAIAAMVAGCATARALRLRAGGDRMGRQLWEHQAKLRRDALGY